MRQTLAVKDCRAERTVTSKDGAMDLPTPDGVPQVVGVVRWSLGTSIVGAYLFGSSTVGGLKPQSDLDVLGRVCKFDFPRYTMEYEPRRFDQRTMGAAPTLAPTPTTTYWATRP